MIKLLLEAMPHIEPLCSAHHVKYLAVFGSAVGDRFSPESDVDLLVEFEDGLSAREYAADFFELKFQLESILGRPVDLVTAKSLSNPYFRESVMSEQKALYAA
ncbi:DNA polymerase beta domain-containing protein [Marinobacter lipolyticus SM19]|uniref:DNA polymerase beta domain-containing protein n=1 Tax=Marinobacter lipolyticus SM19 TaxID=1318628 RepID=R8B5Q6_9GAMM|nr:nucleotidyltransferase family protein [Marinobacter lipolyticus]EON93891.1 DNA polymerase beta domain-containing protein [Marinobacter lipolyticus SM19]